MPPERLDQPLIYLCEPLTHKVDDIPKGTERVRQVIVTYRLPVFRPAGFKCLAFRNAKAYSIGLDFIE